MPEPMPKISLNVPAYTNDDYQTSFPASYANNATYGSSNWWRCIAAPLGNANSGTLSQYPSFTTPFPVYLAYDLSGVPLYQRGKVLLAWYNDSPGVGAYDPGLISNNHANQARDYTIDVNAAAGGSLPGSGWVTKVTVTNNTYHSRQHSFDMSGYNWVRINVTASTGQAAGGNNNVVMNMDIHDAHLGYQDDWIFYGDSIPSSALNHDDGTSGFGNTAPTQINTSKSAYFPVWENGCIGGFTATDMVTYVGPTFLPLFHGHYVALPLGTNDANSGGSLLSTFSSSMQSMINSIVAAGMIPVIPHIPYGKTATIIANGPTINADIDALIAANPTAIAGPDLWTYFFNNQTLIDVDNIHPTSPAGMTAYRTQWVNWATANIYNLKQINTDAQSTYKVRSVLTSKAQTSYKVRTVLKSQARTSFKIQVGTVASPLPVSGVITTPFFARPLSTVTSVATVLNSSNALQDGLTATCVVTYPDNSTLTAQVYAIGSGQYETVYQTKGVGTVSELWTFTSSIGGQGEYQHHYLCQFDTNS